MESSLNKQSNITSWNFREPSNIFHTLTQSIPTSTPKIHIEGIHTPLQGVINNLFPTRQWLKSNINNAFTLNADETTVNESEAWENLEYPNELQNVTELKRNYLRALVVISDMKVKLTNNALHSSRPTDFNLDAKQQQNFDISLLENKLVTLSMLRDKQELRIAKLSYENYELEYKHSKLIASFRHLQNNFETLSDQQRLTSYDLINTKEALYDARQLNRDLERERGAQLLHITNLNVNIAQQNNDMKSKNSTIESLLSKIEAVNKMAVSELQTTSKEFFEKIEHLTMANEDSYGQIHKLAVKLDSRDQEIKSLNAVISNLCKELEVKTTKINELKIEISVQSTKQSNVERKNKSLTNELTNKLYTTAPLTIEIHNLKMRIEELTYERDAFREAMLLSLDTINSATTELSENKHRTGNDNLSYLPRLWSCSADIDTTDLLFPNNH